MENHTQNKKGSSNIGFKEFCDQTSLHGWGFITLGKFRPIPTIFWLLAIISAFILCFKLTLLNVNEFMGEVEFNVETLTGQLEEVYFPAVYIRGSTSLVRLEGSARQPKARPGSSSNFLRRA